MPALLTSSGRPGFYFRVLQEGEVGAGDEIVKVGEAKERMTVAEINALLYSPDHARDRLERALRIEALSPGWRSSFEALLQSQDARERQRGARAGSGCASGCTGISAARGDGDRSGVRGRPLADDAEPGRSAAADGAARPVRGLASSTDRRRPAALSQLLAFGPLSTERYRISVKIEPNGVAGTYLREHVRVGDALDVSSPRGSFILQSGERPVVLLSAGIGATPVLAMLHALAAARSTRQVLWLHAARDRQHHPFAAEVRRLMLALTHGRSYVCYSRPGSHDKMGEDFDATGHLSRSVFDEVGVPREADVYLCGPTRFMADMKEALATLGVAPERIHVEIFNGSESMTPGVVGAATRAPHLPAGRRQHRSAGIVRAQRHRRTLECVGLPEHLGAGRGVRRPGPLVVPDRRLSQLRERSGFGGGRLRTGATRQARRRQPSRLLLTTDSRRRHRFVKPERIREHRSKASGSTRICPASARR